MHDGLHGMADFKVHGAALALLIALWPAYVGAVWSGDFAVSTGRDFSLVSSPYEGQVLAMGDNRYGQLGLEAETMNVSSPTPVMLPAGEQVVDMAAGTFHSLFVMESGIAYSTGRNHHGQLGVPPSAPVASTRVPLEVEALSSANCTVIAVAAGYAHSLFLLSNGTVQAVGMNNHGQLGDGTKDSTMDMVTPLGLPDSVKAIAAGYDFSYFLLESGEVFAAGNNLGGQLGDGTRETPTMPVKVALSMPVVAMSAGVSHGLFVTADDVLLGTGANFDGQLGNDSATFEASPVEMATSHGAVQFARAGGDSSCFLPSESEGEGELARQLLGLGSNRVGQLGLGEVVTTGSPLIIPLPQTATNVALAEEHSLFLALDRVFASGLNAFGQLGDSTQESRTVPVEAYQATTTATTTTETATLTVTSTITRSATSTATETTTTKPVTTTTSATRRVQQQIGLDIPAAIVWLGSVALTGVALGFHIVCKDRSLGGLDEGETDLRGDNELELMRAEMLSEASRGEIIAEV